MTFKRATIGGVRVTFDHTTIPLENRALVELLNVSADAQREGRFDQADEILRQAVVEHALTELPIEVLCPLPVRLFNALRDGRVATNVDEIVRCELSDLRRVKNLGHVSISLLGTRLRTLKLNLKGQFDYAWIRPLPTRLREYWRLIPTFKWQVYSRTSPIRVRSPFPDVLIEPIGAEEDFLDILDI